MAQPPSRRLLLSTAALAPLAAFLGRHALAIPAQSDPAWDAAVDAELVAMCDRLVESRAELERLYSGPGSPADPDNHPVVGPRLAALDAIEDEIIPLLAGMRAETWECAEAMARVAYMFVERDHEGCVKEEGRDWPRVAVIEWLVGDEFYRWVESGPQHRPLRVPPPRWRSAAALALPVTPITAPDTDAELIRLCQQHIVMARAYEDAPGTHLGDPDPLWDILDCLTRCHPADAGQDNGRRDGEGTAGRAAGGHRLQGRRRRLG